MAQLPWLLAIKKLIKLRFNQYNVVNPFTFLHNENLLLKLECARKTDCKLAAIYLDIVKFREIETMYGQNVCRLVLRTFKEIMNLLHFDDARTSMLGWQSLGGDDMAIYLQAPPDYKYQDLYALATVLHQQAELLLNERLRLPTVHLHLGYAFMDTAGNRSIESVIYSVLKESLQIAKSPFSFAYWQQVEELKNIIESKNLATVYQPIISLKNGDIFGYEALSRGPADSSLYSPGVLFPLAEKSGYLYPIEKITRQLAIERFAGFSPEQKLFLNFNPQIVNDPQFAGGQTKAILEKRGLRPQNIVWEITERTSIKDFTTFKHALEHYRKQGYLIAIDDAGAGYSSLQSIAELQPDFIKIDMSLVKGIAGCPVKQALLETFVTFASKINSALIAEGIEEEEDLKTLKRLGVTYGQGFYIAKPAYPLPQVKGGIIELINSSDLINQSFYNPEDIKAEHLAIPTPTYGPNDSTKTIINHFKQHPDQNSIVIVSNNQPLGLVMRDKLFSSLASQYGVSLYWEKPVSMLMDANPLKVRHDANLPTLAQNCKNRANNKLYDDIIVVQDCQYLGSIPVQKLLDTLTEIKMELARITIPLTNLPGAPIIQEKLKTVIQNKKPFAVIYADLDNFKAYNDKYGFERGDEVIKLAARAITQALANHGTPTDFVGHVGGDDFVAITHPDVVETICKEIISYFDSNIKDLYDWVDRNRGGIYTLNRGKNFNFFPFTSISLGVVDNKSKNFNSHLEISEILADLKKYAKTIPGSNFVRDRRI